MSMNGSKTIIFLFFFFIIEPWRDHYMKNWFLIKLGSGLRIKLEYSWSFGDVIIFYDKINTHIGWNFFSQHRTLSLIEYLGNFVQNSRIHIFYDQISEFQSDSWEIWSSSYQYRVDFVDAMTFKIHDRSKKYSKYCTPNESIDTLAWQWT